MFECPINTQNGMEIVKCYEISDIDTLYFTCNTLKAFSNYKPNLIEEPIFLDTETSYIKYQDTYITWIYQFAMLWNGYYLVGRKPSEIMQWIDKLIKDLELTESKKIIIYIHNMSYDYYFLREFFNEKYGIPRTLAVNSHKYLQVEYKHFIIKCTWKLSNKSLYEWGHSYNTLHQKLLGAIDYEKVVYQDSELDLKTDWSYQLLDVATMKDCFEIETRGFDLRNIPLTSTGFVRYDMRKIFLTDKENRKLFLSMKLNKNKYEAARAAFAGAYTHGNRIYRGDLLTEFIKDGTLQFLKHRDYRSFYPSTQECDLFPMEQFSLYYLHKQKNDNEGMYLVNKYKRTHAMLIYVYIEGAYLKKNIAFPYLSVDKARKGKTTSLSSLINDNGRIVECQEGFFLWVTEMDFDIIQRQYDIKRFIVLEIYIAKKMLLPKWMRDGINDYFYKKSALKGYEKLSDENEKIYKMIEYTKSKNKLNSVYGMTASKIVRDEHIFDLEEFEWYTKKVKDAQGALDKYYKSRNSFMSYQHGVWTTANTRYRIIDMSEFVGFENSIYTDTDSLFYYSNNELEEKFNALNTQNKEERIKNNQYIECDGKVIEYMAFEDENDNLSKFKFLHSKCYGYENKKGEMHITIAGVSHYYREDSGLEPKKRRTREQELGSLENLKEGFTFVHCGGTRSEYVYNKPRVENINGHMTEYASGCIVLPTTKKLRNSMDTASIVNYEIEEGSILDV